MLTVRKLRYLTSAATASLVLVAAAGDKFGDQLLSTSEFVHTAQVNNGGVIGGGTSSSVSGGGGTTNSAGAMRSGPTYKPR